MSVVATSPLSSMEAMLHSLMGRSGGGGGDETRIDDEREEEEEDALQSPPAPPPLPVRPTARGRLPSLSRVAGAAAGSWAQPSTPSPHEDEGDEAFTVDIPVTTAELERKAAEAQLRQKEEENAALRRRIESYHVRWLEYEIRIKSLEEAFHDQLASLQMARDAARMAQELPHSYEDRHGAVEPHVTKESGEDAPPGRLWQAGRRRSADGSSRSSVVGRLGAEFQRGSQALEKGAAALAAEPWQPGVPSADAVGDLKKLKAQFRKWKKDYKARLRKAKAEIDRDRRRQSSCWI